MTSELEALRQETEQLKNQIRVSVLLFNFNFILTATFSTKLLRKVIIKPLKKILESLQSLSTKIFLKVFRKRRKMRLYKLTASFMPFFSNHLPTLSFSDSHFYPSISQLIRKYLWFFNLDCYRINRIRNRTTLRRLTNWIVYFVCHSSSVISFWPPINTFTWLISFLNYDYHIAIAFRLFLQHQNVLFVFFFSHHSYYAITAKIVTSWNCNAAATFCYISDEILNTKKLSKFK